MSVATKAEFDVWEHTGIVHQIVRTRFRAAVERLKMDEDDLVSAGMIGLIKAGKHYDPSLGRFSTLAYRVIMQSIWHHINEFRSRVIRLPHCRIEDMAEHLQPIARAACSVHTAGHGRNERGCDTVLAFIEDLYEHPASEMIHIEIRARVQSAINELPERLQRLVRDRMAGKKLRQIGEAEGMSRERVRQLLERAYDHLRVSLADLDPGQPD